jgi:hypothetical protein
MVSMQGLKTISFSEGENRTPDDVAYQQDTGTRSAHPFLHRVPAKACQFQEREDTGRSPAMSIKTRRKPVSFGQSRTKFSQLKSP